MTPIAISVLVTVFNRAAYLRECLDSILASSCGDFELVVVDDASTDTSFDIAEDIASRDSRVRAFRNETNLGDYANRNRAASLATGEFLKFVDADDFIYPYTLDVMLSGMRRHPLAALGLSWSVVDPDRPFPFVSSPRETYEAHFLGTSLLGVGPTASIIRRSAFNESGGFGARQFVGDAELWLRLTERWPLVSFPPSLVWWRVHDGQQIALERRRPEVLAARFEIENRFLESSSHLLATEKMVARKRVRRRYARRLISLAVRERAPLHAARLWRTSGIPLSETLTAAFAHEKRSH